MIDEYREVMCTVQGVTVSEDEKCTAEEPDVSAIVNDLQCMRILEEAMAKKQKWSH